MASRVAPDVARRAGAAPSARTRFHQRDRAYLLHFLRAARLFERPGDVRGGAGPASWPGGSGLSSRDLCRLARGLGVPALDLDPLRRLLRGRGGISRDAQRRRAAGRIRHGRGADRSPGRGGRAASTRVDRGPRLPFAGGVVDRLGRPAASPRARGLCAARLSFGDQSRRARRAVPHCDAQGPQLPLCRARPARRGPADGSERAATRTLAPRRPHRTAQPPLFRADLPHRLSRGERTGRRSGGDDDRRRSLQAVQRHA